MSRFVYVDDTDPAISYSGSWTLSTDSFLNVGNWGQPYRQTLHGASSSSSLTYRFTGTNVRLTGVSPPGNVAGLSWECFVDDRSLGTQRGASSRVNNWKFCDSGALEYGEHTLQFIVTISSTSSDATFWFDRLEYTPGANDDVSGKDVLLENGHALMAFGGDWETTAIEHRTQQTDASVTISFSGTSVTWFAFVPTNFPSASGRATYRIDNQDEVAFQTAQVSPGGGERFNQILFQTPQLSPGPHTLTTTFRGDSNNAPLVLDKVVVAWQGANTVDPPTVGGGSSGGNGSGSGIVTTIIDGGTTRTMTQQPTSGSIRTNTASLTNSDGGVVLAPDPTSTGSDQSQTGGATSNNNIDSATRSGPSAPAIAGIAVGSTLIVVTLVLAALFFCRRRLRRNRPNHAVLPSSGRSIPPSDQNLRNVSPFSDPFTNPSPQDVHSIPPSDGGTESIIRSPSNGRTRSDARTPSPQFEPNPGHAQLYVIPPTKHRTEAGYPQSMGAALLSDNHHQQPMMTQPSGGKGAIITPYSGPLAPLRATPASMDVDSRSDSTGPTDTSSVSRVDTADGTRLVRRHEDSGFRMQFQSIIDLPPDYTAR